MRRIRKHFQIKIILLLAITWSCQTDETYLPAENEVTLDSEGLIQTSFGKKLENPY